MEKATVDDNTQWVTQHTWEDGLDQQLAQRLMRPAMQPGVINLQMARAIMARSQRLRDRLSLLTQQQQRWSGVNLLQLGDIPIVYAQLQPQAANITNKTITNKTIANTISPVFTSVSPSDVSPSDLSPSDNILPMVQARLKKTSPNVSDLVIQRQLGSSSLDQRAREKIGNSLQSEPSGFLPDTRPAIPGRSMNAPSNSLPLIQPLIQRQPVSEATAQQRSEPQSEHPGFSGSLPIVQAKEVNRAIASLSSPVLLSTSLLNASEPDGADLRTGLRTVGNAHPISNPTLSNPASNQGMPIVQAIAPTTKRFPTPHEPLVFSRSSGTPALASQENVPDDEIVYAATHGVLGRAIAPAIRPSAANANPVDQVTPVARVEVNQTPETLQPSNLDLEVLVNQVERQIMRRLVIERERRGLR